MLFDYAITPTHGNWFQTNQNGIGWSNSYTVTYGCVTNGKNMALQRSDIASPLCHEGQSERTFPIFAFSSRFSVFSRFLANFALSGGTLTPAPPHWLRYCFSGKFDQHLLLNLWFSRTEITDGTWILVLVRVLWDTISKIYWQLWHSFFKSTLENSYNFYPIEITWRKISTFSLFDTSDNGNVTFAYILPFHFTSVYRIVSNKRSPSNKRPPNLFSNKTR